MRNAAGRTGDVEAHAHRAVGHIARLVRVRAVLVVEPASNRSAAEHHARRAARPEGSPRVPHDHAAGRALHRLDQPGLLRPSGGDLRRERWLIGTTRVQPFSMVKSVSIPGHSRASDGHTTRRMCGGRQVMTQRNICLNVSEEGLRRTDCVDHPGALRRRHRLEVARRVDMEAARRRSTPCGLRARLNHAVRVALRQTTPALSGSQRGGKRLGTHEEVADNTLHVPASQR